MKCIFNILMFFIFLPNGYSAHLIGGVITYENVGNDTYNFVMKIYRDCYGNGAPYDSEPNGPNTIDASITIFIGSDIFKTLILARPIITEIDGSLQNSCVIIPPDLCVEEGVYKFSMVLPKSSSSYYVSYQRCCRNGTVSNIIRPSATGFTTTVEITPLAQELGNSCPVYNEFPPILICGGLPFKFDHSATDKNNDELVYELCAPLRGADLDDMNFAPDPDAPPPYDSVHFVNPHSVQKPFTSDPAIRIDSKTGLITGTPVYDGQYVVGICVSEYRNGILLSKVTRDFQFNVVNCRVKVKAALEASEKVAPNDYIVYLCGDSTIIFRNESYDREFITSFRWEFDINGEKDISYYWNKTINFPGYGHYTGHLYMNPGSDCADTANVFVNIFPDITADFEYSYDTCVSGPVSFYDKSFALMSDVIEWNWDFGDDSRDTIQHPMHQYMLPGIKDVALTVVDTNGCFETKELSAQWNPAPVEIVIEPDFTKGCAPQDVFFENLSIPVDTSYLLNWSFGDGKFSTDVNPRHVYKDAGIYSVSVDITSPTGCSISKYFDELVLVNPRPKADFSFNPHQLTRFNSEVNFQDKSTDALAWRWFFEYQEESYDRNPIYNFPDTGIYEVRQIVTNIFGCKDTLYKKLDVEPVVSYFLPNAFSPNDDTQNDFFIGKGIIGGMKNFNMTIFNRWGEIIFESFDPTVGWNGLENNEGSPLPIGVYTYFVNYFDPRGNYFEEKGFVSLIL